MLRRKKIMINSLTIVVVLMLMVSTALAQSKWGNYSFTWVDHTPNPRFAIYDPGTPGDELDDLVLDKSTRIIWARNGNLAGVTKTWQDAMQYCLNDVTLGNTKGWRLPTIEELQSVQDVSQTWPYLPVGHPFTNYCTGQCGYWSSSTREDDSAKAYVHYYWDEEYNTIGWADKTDTDFYYAWPVLGGNGYATGNWEPGAAGECSPCLGTLSALGRWCDQGDGTVKDMTTCLVWLKKADWGGIKPWMDVEGQLGDAHTRAGILYAGMSGADLSDESVVGDWRLPTKTELVALIEGTEYIRTSQMYFFTGVQSGSYWSSTTDASDTDDAWLVHLELGYSFCLFKVNNRYTWPVRGGQ